MNKLFADWHNEVSINISGEILTARSDACDAIVADIDAAKAMQLVAIAHGRSADGEAEWFYDVIKEADNTFRLRNNTREAGLLASACLWQIVDDESDMSVLVGYACEVVAKEDWKPVIPDLTSRATVGLSDLGARRRALPSPPMPKKIGFWTKSLNDYISTTFSEAETPMTANGVREAFVRMGNSVQTCVDSLSAQAASDRAWADTAISICSEESEHIGWLLSGTSVELGVPWATVGASGAGVLAARELANLCTQLPAPPYADAFLRQLLAATSFDAKSRVSVPELDVPSPLKALVTPVDASQTPSDQAQQSLRQACLLRAWQAVE